MFGKKQIGGAECLYRPERDSDHTEKLMITEESVKVVKAQTSCTD